MRDRMLRLAAMMLTGAILAGCVTSATGPKFTAASQDALGGSQGRIYVLRQNAAYVVQAPYIARPQVAVDGRAVGILRNGGYLVVDVPAGEHSLSMGFGSEPTVRTFTIAPGGSVYFVAYDKTRMEGARWAAAGVTAAAGGGIVAGAAGGVGQVLDEQAEAAARGEGRVWSLDPVPAPIALDKLRGLARSD